MIAGEIFLAGALSVLMAAPVWSGPGSLITAGRRYKLPTKTIVHFQKNEMIQARYVPNGSWGANGIRLQVTSAGTTVEFPCADGEVAGRIKLDNKGNFKASGTYTFIRPGPVREGLGHPSRPARYEGRISGGNMTLKITLSDSNEAIGSYELRKGAGGRLHRCL